MRLAVVVGVLGGLAGCRQIFGIDDTQVAGDAASASPDADPGAPDAALITDVAHLSAAHEAELTVTGAVTITGLTHLDTTSGIALPAIPGLVTHTWNQEGGGPELLVIDANVVTITGTLAVTGTRPLVIVAAHVVIPAGGAIDVGGHGATPGAGGATGGAGPSAGGAGVTSGQYDGGAGGAGFGGEGGAGGTSGPAQGALGGSPHGAPELAVLEGGSGGGAISRCPPSGAGGAGGGAVQLTAFVDLLVDGSIAAGGGGGAGGAVCAGNSSGGAGGGAGGAIYLQARSLAGTGALAANGGGGGGAALNPLGDGQPGDDGALGSSPARGGLAQDTGDGGDGGAGITPAAPGADGANGGGGGGAVGRIVVDATTSTATLQSSPPTFIPP